MKKFAHKCQRIAVCFYGQYRAGDYLSAYFREMVEATGCTVDFFCSSKRIATYEFSKSAEAQGKNAAEYVDGGDLESKLWHNWQAKSVNIIPDEVDKTFAERDCPRNGIFYSMSDSIRLKTEHENANHFVYDIVVLTRYDVLLSPVNLWDYLRRWYNSIELVEFEQTMGYPLYNNWLITQPLYSKDWGTWGLQDIVLVGSSYSMDALATELQFLMYGNLEQFATKSPIAHTMCGHTSLFHAARQAGLCCTTKYPFVDIRNDSLTYDETVPKNKRKPWLEFSLLRDTWDLDKLTAEVPVNSHKAVRFYTKQWVSDRIKIKL
ncbi:MAG: hypothetical protein CBE00_13240 [Planctomycetaceae bacterium TMED240]|nr:MAG: hypothetical protein CBE00_13240 [Planctomycetaceae bacterium TMED240]